MLYEWLELLMWVFLLLVTWLSVAVVLAQLEMGEARDARRDRAARGMPAKDVTGTGRVAGQPSQAENPRPATQLYADVARDHRDHGDEDPLAYGAPQPGPFVAITCADPTCGGQMFRARDGSRCNKCGRLLGSPLKPIFAKTLGVAPRQRVARRRDGIQLSDEANAALLKTIFGERE